MSLGLSASEIRKRIAEVKRALPASSLERKRVIAIYQRELRALGARRKNPTKAQRRARASRTAKNRGIVAAVKGLLKKTNPSAKITGAKVVKLKGGVLKITPIRDNPGKAARHVRATRKRVARSLGYKSGRVTDWVKEAYQTRSTQRRRAARGGAGPKGRR